VESTCNLPPTWKIPKSIRVRVGDTAGRQRVIFEENDLLLVVHKAPEAGDTHRVGRYLWRSAYGVWSASDGGDGPAVLMKHLAEYAAMVAIFDQQEEKANSAQEYFLVIEGLLPLIRSTAHMHQVLQEARKLIPDDRGLINARDQAYELERTVDLLYTNAKNGLDFEIAKRAEEEAIASSTMARSAHRLNVLVGFFFPLATVSSLMGMDMDNLSPNEWSRMGMIVIAGLLAGLILAMFITRQRGEATAAAVKTGLAKAKRR
jgi:hypothetical protein